MHHSFRILVTLCRGIKCANGEPLLDPEALLWKKLMPKHIKRIPSNDQWKFEIVRRWKDCLVGVDGIFVQPRPGSWKSAWLLDYLDMYPIWNPLDIDFLNQTVTTRLRLAEQAHEQARINNWNCPDQI
jgi:hypothetical protein